MHKKRLISLKFLINKIFVKNLLKLKKSYRLFKKIKTFSYKYSIILIPKIIHSNFFIINKEEIISKKLYFEKKYKFNYNDWFSNNIPIWKKFLIKIDKINYLEIGSYEGRSTIFIGELKNINSITAVDTWEGSHEHNENPNFIKVFKNFKYNINILNKNNIKYFKTTSDNFFFEQ